MKKILFIIGFTIYVLTVLLSCTGTKHLIKTVNKAFSDSISKTENDSSWLKIDTSKYTTEVVIEYDSTRFSDKLKSGADPYWGEVADSDYVIIKRDGWYSGPAIATFNQPIKRITIKTNVQLHKSDSAVYHAQAKVKTISKEVAVNKEVNKKTRSYWWIFLLIIPILFLLYQKYKSKLPKWFTFLGGLKIF